MQLKHWKLLASLAAVCLLVSSTGLAAAQTVPGGVQAMASWVWDHLSTGRPTGTPSSALSVNATTFQSWAADDFEVPVGTKSLVVRQVEVEGTGNITNKTVNVCFYADNGAGLPAGTPTVCSNGLRPLDLTGGTYTGLAGGDFTVNLFAAIPQTASLQRYWISMQVNIGADTVNKWYWYEREILEGNPSAWKGTGSALCSNWGHRVADCSVPDTGSTGQDLLFRLSGDPEVDVRYVYLPVISR